MNNNDIFIDGNNNIVIQDINGSHIYLNSDEDVKRLLDEHKDKIDHIIDLLRSHPSTNSQQFANKIFQIRSIGTAHFHFYSESKKQHHLVTPPFVADVFLGREQELNDIYEHLTKSNILLISGAGGVGKTTLASHYYHKYSSSYKHLGWILGEPNISSALLGLADSIGLQFEDKQSQTERLQKLLTTIADLPERILLIFDNINELSDLKENYQNLRRLTNADLLITTRITKFEQAPVYRIGGLPVEQAKELFKTYYNDHNDRDDELLENLYKAIDGNTLVIELLAKNLQQFNQLEIKYPLSSLLDNLENQGLFSIHSKSVNTDYHQSDGATQIIAAMYDLGKLEPEEKRIMSIFAVLPPEGISFRNLSSLLPKTTKIDDLITSLTQRGWLDLFEEQKTFKCSPVIQSIVREKNHNLRLDCQELVEALKNNMRTAWEEYYQNHEQAILFNRYATSLLVFFKEADNDLAILNDKIGCFYETSGNLILALEYFNQFYRIETSLATANPDNLYFTKGLAVAAERLGDIYSSLGEFDKALEYFREYESLGSKLSQIDTENVDYISMLSIAYAWLGQTYLALNDLDSSLSFFERYNALCLMLTEKDPNNSGYKNRLSHSYAKLGQIHVSIENFHQADAFFKARNSISEQIFKDCPDNLTFKNSFADSLAKMGMIQLINSDFSSAKNHLAEYCRIVEELYSQAQDNNWVIKSNYAESLAIKAALGFVDDQPLVSNFAIAQNHFDNIQQLSKIKNIDHKKTIVDKMKESAYTYCSLIIELLKD